MEEIWKPILGYNGNYEISNFGRIKTNTKKGKYLGGILKQTADKSGYMRIRLGSKEKKKSFIVHRLVAKHFLPNKENKPDVNHIDFNRKNNIVSNLEWVTRKENVEYSTKAGKYKLRKKRVNPMSIKQRALALGLKPVTIVARIRRGMNIEQALSTPINRKY